MQQLLAAWQNLDGRRRAMFAAAGFAVFAALMVMSSLMMAPSMALLYANLPREGAGEIISALERESVIFEVKNDSIYVDASRRDELRMILAGEGLPRSGTSGYELLDNLSGFGTTSQMFDAAYWRAKEGELARTIVSAPDIRFARVHIAVPTTRGFRDTRKPTASVTVTTGASGLSIQRAKALKYLVASAVADLTPDDVSIIDSEKGLIGGPDDEANNDTAETKAMELKHNVERLLEARVGYGNAIVELSVETVTEREAITERRIDPQTRVAISTDLEERSKSADDTKPGAVTVASNLPEGDGANGGKSQSKSSETRERTNYEVSETTRELLRTPGAIKRLTVAVLIDGVETVAENGETTWQPRSDEELTAFRELVASAVGFNEARGDEITIRSMQFEALPEAGSNAEAGLLLAQPLDLMKIIQLTVTAIVALVLGLFVLRPMLTQQKAAALPAPTQEEDESTALTGEITEDELPMQDMQVVSDFGLDDLDMPMIMNDPFAAQAEDPVERIKKLIEERQSETVELLRSWMEEEEQA